MLASLLLLAILGLGGEGLIPLLLRLRPRSPGGPGPAVAAPPAGNPAAISAHGLRKHYGGVRALDGLDLEVAAGETVALVGANGSGKSTALRLMAGIYPPTEGSISRSGRLVAVIELGATFQPELTGVENVELYAAALGMTRRESASRLPQIIAFAGVEEFADVPLKYYSSGMRSRLAFSIAVSTDPDTLLLDEVLAVGDAEFRLKCYEKLAAFQGRGGTLVVVSHDAESVRELCTRAVWLDGGEIRMDGPVDEVLAAYESTAEPVS
jgi:ABC-type polysaccharide/polyol phosphate transport system ATPase subunit